MEKKLHAVVQYEKYKREIIKQGKNHLKTNFTPFFFYTFDWDAHDLWVITIHMLVIYMNTVYVCM